MVADAELTADVIEERNAELMVVENQAGAVQYRNILPSTNLEYAVTSSSVKESIVVREPQSEYKYYFDMDLDGLTPVENNDGSISLTESGDTANEIFWIEAPYMYDANNDESFAVTMSLTEVEGKYVLAVEADKDWINAADRAFPVVIDPTLHLSGTYIDDAFVISGLQMNSLRRGKELRVGRNLTNLTRTYMKIKMPVNISAQSVIQEATLKLKKASYFQALGQSDVNINAYLFCRGKISWDFDTLEWGNQPYGYANNTFRWYDDDMLDSVPANKQTETYSFNILNAVKRWIATGDNRGVAIVSSDETSKTQVDCHSSRALRELDRPALCIYYSMPMIEPSSLSFNHFAETKSVRVVCGGAWVATTDSSWLAMSPQSGNDSSQLFLHVRKNSSASSRLGTVTVKSGNTVIGVLSVTQFGSDPSLLISEDSWITNCGEDSKTFAITSNDSWTVESSEPWLTVSPLSGEENGVITVNTSANDGSDTRTGTITLSTAHGTESKTISVTQLDKVSNYFYSVSENGSFGRNSSSDYNHKLATWAMELSYAAYNYPNGEELPIIPGAFMGDFTQTAGMLLEDNGFVNIAEYNYTSDNRAAHTIGWRPIEVDVSETSQIINDTGGMDNVYQYNIDDKGSVLYNLLDSVCVYERNTCRSNSGNPEIMDRNVDVLEVSENSLATTTIKNLVVIDIRGSVTLLDWGNDIVTQFAPNNNRFAALADEVLTNVENYLSSTGLQDPIILVTGHSMGAAIANILAARLNETMDSGDIYAYTFATQLDRVSNCFNNIDSYGNVTAVTASDYNHRLATWAMELSYAAYNYPNGEELPIIPGAFMGDFTQTAGMLLEDNGFVNISEYNYTSDSRAAHTIGWRPINVDVSETSQIINDAGGMDNVYQYNIDDKGSVLYNLLDSVCVCDYDQGRNYFRDDTVVIEENTALNTSQDDEVGTKPLVVVDVRGSVTISDWINDVMTQFDSENNRFAAFADEIFTNVENYLSSTGVQNPIILVTGHSMGAAIANILAARLNGIMDPGNVYAYTFATPRTVNEAVSGNQAVNYPNIFNILNSNDVVTYVPLTITLPVVNYWKRHGIDLYINMPYSESRETDILGMPCHSMSVYLNWLNSSENLSLQEMLALSEEARVRGLLPIIAKIKCPVGVTIKDSNGNIIGYESQQENAVYPDMLDNGVMSWIEEDGAKMFFIPSIADAASIEIEAYDYGSMNFTVGSVDASTESEIKTLNNISLYPGKEFIADISEDVPVEDTQIFITENGETVGEVTETNPHLKGTRVWHEVCNNGGKDFVVTHWTFTTDKTVTEIHARNKYEGYSYLKPDDS